MCSLEVTLAHFYQFAAHWKNGDQANLNLSCESGKLQLEFSTHLNHPDLQHFEKSKKSSSSRLRRQERRHPVTKEAETTVKSEPTKIKESKIAETQTVHACNICGKIFEVDNDLVYHVQNVHNVCDICEIRFDNHETLEKHFLMYHIPNRFKCFYCVKSFTKEHLLQTHALKAHNQCRICEKQFKTADLESHTDMCDLENY